MVDELKHLRIGYLPYSPDLSHPADRRRFPAYARSRGLRLEIAKPTESYDLIVVTQRADLAKWSRHPGRNGKIVFEMIDSYHAIPKTNVKGLLRGAAKYWSGELSRLQFDYWATLENMCRRADAVVCATEKQSQFAQRFCKNEHIILDIHSDVVRHVKQCYAAGETFNFVWEGLPGNTIFLEEISEVLADLSSRHKIALHVVTDLEYRQYLGRYLKRNTKVQLEKLFKNHYLYQWHQQMLSAIVTQCDLALIPVPLNQPLESGKPENKLLLFWRMGMPVVTSATPAYISAMRQAGLDLYCRTAQDWNRVLERCISDEDIRREAGRRGNCTAEANWSTDKLLGRWDILMTSLFPDLCPVPDRN